MTLDYFSSHKPRRKWDWLGHTIGQVRPMVGALYIYGLVSVAAVSATLHLLWIGVDYPGVIWILLVWNAAGMVAAPWGGFWIIRGRRGGIALAAWAALALIAAGNIATAVVLQPQPQLLGHIMLVPLLPFTFFVLRGLLSGDLQDHLREMNLQPASEPPPTASPAGTAAPTPRR